MIHEIIDVIELLKIIILSIVQGITEWLPISSTGHMIILEDLIPLNLSSEFIEMFLVLVQLGSIFAVVVLYFHKLNPLSSAKSSKEKKSIWLLWFKVAFATLPAGLFGLIFDEWIDAHLFNPITVSITLILYGIAFIIIENQPQGRHSREISRFDELSFASAFKIGLFQMLALIPGTSRSGSTIMGGLLVGTSRFVATEFSFFLSIPVMFGASFYKLYKFGFHFTLAESIYLLTGMFVAFIVSIIVIRFLLNYLKRNDFTPFGWYRIILGIAVLAYSYFL